MKVLNRTNVTKLLIKLQDEGGAAGNSIATQAIKDFGLTALHKELTNPNAQAHTPERVVPVNGLFRFKCQGDWDYGVNHGDSYTLISSYGRPEQVADWIEREYLRKGSKRKGAPVILYTAIWPRDESAKGPYIRQTLVWIKAQEAYDYFKSLA